MDAMSVQGRAEQAALDPNRRKLTPASMTAIKAHLVARHGENHTAFFDHKTRVKDAWERECDAHGVPKPASTRKVAKVEEKEAKKLADEGLAAAKERSAAEILRRKEEVDGAEAAHPCSWRLTRRRRRARVSPPSRRMPSRSSRMRFKSCRTPSTPAAERGVL